jgi:predicted transcriptional regulator
MMMVLNRQEKEELVLDLYYNKKKTYHEIAKEARISTRDIKKILNRASKESESEHSMSISSQAYKLFSEGRTPMQVAIALNLRENEVTQYYKEYWSYSKLLLVCYNNNEMRIDSYLQYYVGCSGWRY